jgi:hypothetical protein
MEIALSLNERMPYLLKKILLVILRGLFTILVLPSQAQLCPGGGANFNSAVSFDPAWIYGCNTGTSCNGGSAFDNRSSCEPITAMDACAPAPSCGSIPNSGSDIWFTFYASAPTALISCFQNTSLIIGVQAFKGGPSCGSLVEIGCVLSGGPSSGVQLSLSGLSPGILYYFRVFGNAGPVSQRTGLYCFCGSTGVGNYLLLSTVISDFSGQPARNKIRLEWTAGSGISNQVFEVERSADGNSFARLAAIPGEQINGLKKYQYTDELPVNGINYYRLRHILPDGHADYSNTISAETASPTGFTILTNPVTRTVQLLVKDPATFILSAISGQPLKTFYLVPGIHALDTGQLPNGIYVLQSVKVGNAQKFFVSR